MRSNILDQQLSALSDDLFEPFRGKRVLVTGATGLIGSLFCKALLLANCRLGIGCCVLAVVRSRQKADYILGDYASFGGLNVIECDFSSNTLPPCEVDYILHAASITKSKVMVERPVEVIETSLRGTGSMLNLARACEARMVYVSSMEMYGTLAEGEVADEDTLGWIDLTSPRSCYPESKRMCECLCNSYAAQYGVRVCSARLAQTFGAGVLPGENRAFAQFARAAMRGENIVLKTKGLSEGNYVDSVDCVAGLLALLACGEAGQAYNVANEESHGTIRDVAELAIDVLGNGLSKVVIDYDETNSAGYAPDVHLRLSSLKLRTLGWTPRFTLADSFSSLRAYLVEQEAAWV